MSLLDRSSVPLLLKADVTTTVRVADVVAGATATLPAAPMLSEATLRTRMTEVGSLLPSAAPKLRLPLAVTAGEADSEPLMFAAAPESIVNAGLASEPVD